MSLSVDQLKRLEFVLSTDLCHHKNSGITPSWKLSKIADELQAIRELIAIKEAEPVAYVVAVTGSDARSISASPGGEFFRLPHGTPLIRKPE